MTFNYRQLRKGDYVLVREPPFKDPVATKVVHRDYDGSIGIEFSTGRRHYFDRKKRLQPHPGWDSASGRRFRGTVSNGPHAEDYGRILPQWRFAPPVIQGRGNNHLANQKRSPWLGFCISVLSARRKRNVLARKRYGLSQRAPTKSRCMHC